MADKKLLEESTIRRFMKLANINAEESKMLTEGNVSTPYSGGADPRKGSKKHLAPKKKHSMKEASSYEEEGMTGMNPMSEEEDMAMDMDGEDTGMDVGGEDFGAGGGDTKTKVEDAVESLKNALNDILDAVDSDKRVEDEAGGDDKAGEEAEPMEEPADEEPGPMEEAEEEGMLHKEAKSKKKEFPFKKGKKDDKKKEDEELDESIELVDDDLVEALLQRVTARLVKEAKGKGGGSTSHSPTGAYKVHKPANKKGNGFSGSGKTLGHSGPHKAKK